MSFISLKEKIKSILNGVANIQQVADYPTENFQGFPACVVRTNGNTSDYETTDENTEIYDFTVYLFQDLANPTMTIIQAREQIEALCDEIRDKFDSDEFLNGVSLPADRTMLGVKPTVSKIFEEESGKYVVAEIDLAVKISKHI